MVTLFLMLNQDIILCRKASYSVGLGSKLSSYGTGANLDLEVRLIGRIDPKTDLVVNLTDVQLALDKLHKQIDHKHFQYDVDGFSGDASSFQDIAQFCWDSLVNELKFENARLHELELHFNDSESVVISDK